MERPRLGRAMGRDEAPSGGDGLSTTALLQAKQQTQASRCFTCGKLGHFQWGCPHMVCSWVCVLQATKVGKRPRPQGRFTIPVTEWKKGVDAN